MLIAIIVVISCIIIAICFGVFFLIKLITHFKEVETRNKILIRLAAVIVITIILGGVNTFLIIKYTMNKLNSGIDDVILPITSENAYRPISEIPNAVIIGRIDKDFSMKVSGDAKTSRQQIDRMAYIELLRAAEEKYGKSDDIDVADITWAFNNTESKVVVSEPVVYSAIGKVIRYGPAK